MLLHFNWPTRKGSVKLTELNTIDNPVVINAFTADVTLHAGESQDTDVLFYYTNTGPVLQNICGNWFAWSINSRSHLVQKSG